MTKGPILIALIFVVGVAKGQTYSLTIYVPPPATYVFTADTMSMKRLGYAVDYSPGLVFTNDGRTLAAVKKVETKSRAEKKIELQEASKRSADFEEILREARGEKPKHDCLPEIVRAWREYERECEPKDSTWEKYETFVAPYDVYVKFPGIPRLFLKKGEKLRYPIEISYSTTTARTPTFEGFLDYLKRLAPAK